MKVIRALAILVATLAPTAHLGCLSTSGGLQPTTGAHNEVITWRQGQIRMAVEPRHCFQVYEAAKYWNLALGMPVLLIACELRDDVDVVVFRGVGLPFCENSPPEMYAATEMAYEGNQTYGAIVYNCADDGPPSYWQTIWRHELGHVLGLFHNNAYQDSLMHEAHSQERTHPLEATAAEIEYLRAVFGRYHEDR